MEILEMKHTVSQIKNSAESFNKTKEAEFQGLNTRLMSYYTQILMKEKKEIMDKVFKNSGACMKDQT